MRPSMKLPLARPRPSRWHRARHVAGAAGWTFAWLLLIGACAFATLVIVKGML